MAGEYDNHTVRISLGDRNLGRSKDVVMGWRQLRRKLSNPLRSSETHRGYCNADIKRKNDLKNAAGWFIAAHVTDGRRKAQNFQDRDIIALDLDNLSRAEFESIIKRKDHWLNQFQFY